MSLVLRRVATDELTGAETEALRRLLWAAFDDDVDGGMTEDDWSHALGGVHVLLERDGEIAGHAAIVERELHLDGRPVRTGYVEAVAIDPSYQRAGLGTVLMAEVSAVIAERYELGALATGSPGFYERLGWRRWAGPTFVRTGSGRRRTPDEDGGILVQATMSTPFELDLSTSISCDWRAGDVW
jgi:aminoglycoside 2'-N-acetyltransferase I